ncbi:diguanylate cyclase [Paenibacillus sp.]|uniref:histidine kinase N-terminal 7TM domain-containing diguanylate cyclase n=1 Tax=Paenibacillus sp. TaxID=58172 RepID=UPI002D4B01E3|nr:diguanylate cyclase [Paenibacillus sp.]HZG57734.1 diguanylate cyclase [Paenibacillus sp.]
MDQTFNGIDFLSALVLLFLFLYVLFTNEIRQLHKVYIAFHLAMMMWPFGMFSLSMTTDQTYQWSYVNLAFVGISFLGYGWLIFSLMLTRGLHRMRKAGYLLLGLPALAAAVLITLNPLHGLFATTSSTWLAERAYGPVFYYLAGMSVLYLMLGSAVMVRTLVKTKDFAFRRQIVLFLLGQSFMLTLALLDTVLTSTPWFPEYAHVEGLTSLGIVFSDICFVIAIRKNNAFRIISIALREVVDSMDTGIAIIDDRHVVLDRNAVAGRFFPLVPGQPFPIEALVEGALEPSFGRGFLSAYFHDPGRFLQTEVLVRDPSPIHVAVKITPIYSDNGAYVGRIVTMQDVTEWRRLVHELNDRNEDLTVRNSELTLMQEELSLANRKLELLATTDSLTGCYNRRYLYQMLEYQIAVEQRYRVPFSILLFDVDHFKQINDTYGHHIGDEVLRHTATLIRARLRESDIFARYGGEEFTIYLPHTEKRDAHRLAEQLRHIVESQVVRTDRGDIQITISMGMISVEGDGYGDANPKEFLVDLMRKADAALYEAKEGGRNRVVVA